MVLEGYFDAEGYVEAEGPYGEFLGYYGGGEEEPGVPLTAITHRATRCSRPRPSAAGHEPHRHRAAHALRTEVLVWRALRSRCASRSRSTPPPSGGNYNVRVALRQRVPGEARNAIAAVFACMANVKNVFVVDPDIDVFSDEQMDWALATRFQPDRDVIVEAACARCRSIRRSTPAGRRQGRLRPHLAVRRERGSS
jgi:2,5-furandicarboxylate decarboxylase 1